MMKTLIIEILFRYRFLQCFSFYVFRRFPIKPSGFKVTGIRKFEFVTKTQFLYIKKYVPKKNKLVYCRIFFK